MQQPINLQEKFSLFSDQWQPKRVARINDYDVRLVRLEGEFVWHAHDDTDEMFLVVEGKMKILFRDGEVTLRAGEMYVVPKGVEHKPVALNECKAMLLEPSTVINTGTAGGDRTAEATDL